MALADDLDRIAAAAAEHGRVAAVIAAEPARGTRTYLIAYANGEAPPSWLVLDDGAQPVERREDVRETASIVAMCELAADLAGGGDLERLRAELARLRIVEQPPGIEAAEEAALELERAVGAPPRVATPSFLDEVGAATMRLEQQLGETSSPFAAAIRSGTGAVDEFVKDVERGYVRDLT
jgi:hypothetical protein